ncbi:MAG: cupin domain-containing protein [Pseudomonadota bacterium]
MTKAVPTQSVDNDRERVTEWRFEPGTATGWHRHGYDYVITPVTGGDAEIADADENRTLFRIKTGVSYVREAGVEHDVINAGKSELVFVEVELKENRSA